MNTLLQKNGIEIHIKRSEVSKEDTFSPKVFNKIRKAIQAEVSNRPKGNYVVIEEDNQIKFVNTQVE